MGIFDPFYVTEVMNDILSRRGLKIELIPKNMQEAPPEKDTDIAKKEAEPA